MEQAYPQSSLTAFASPQFSLSFKTIKLLRSGAFALGVTGLLLFGMTQLIATDYRAPPTDDAPKVAPIHMPPTELTVIKAEPPAKPQEIPPAVPRVEVDPQVEPGDFSTIIDRPTVKAEKQGPVVVDSAPLPIYKPAPRYPRRALARGLEGYVVVEFTITSNGSVRDPSVVGGFDMSGAPTDVFNSAALNAVARFKYRPPVVEGKPVEQHGVRNRITFRMAE
ncbi:energy transducer TonB [Microbulbifer aggregans]|uniref:energy transducer TonB n=1 Tax=Microbulbifer aggregans TaxID=1769779 RepID=UPI001CFCBF98|nr:energy transducer TonB [Microbulbifer aggregans]